MPSLSVEILLVASQACNDFYMVGLRVSDSQIEYSNCNALEGTSTSGRSQLK